MGKKDIGSVAYCRTCNVHGHYTVDCSPLPPATLSMLPVGASFTFPKGTEDAGMLFTVLEQNRERAVVMAHAGLAIEPTYVFKGSESVVLIDE